MRPWNPNPQILRRIAPARNIIGYRDIRARNLERIVSRDSLQNNRRIANRRGQRTNVVQRPRKGNHAPRGHAPISRLDPNAPAQRGRFANRSRRIRPNRRIAKSRSNRGRRSSR
jgi:hypothetical protein